MRRISGVSKVSLLVCGCVAMSLWTNCAHAKGGKGQGGDPGEVAVDPGLLSLKTEKVIIFKDGYGLFIKSATGEADGQGRVYTDKVPEAAVLGSLWAVGDNHKVRSIRAEWIERQRGERKETAAITMLELLRANEGAQVTLKLVGEAGERVSGRLVEVLEIKPERDPKRAPFGAQLEGRLIEAPRVEGGDLVVLDTEDGRMVLPVSDVRNLMGPKLSTRIARDSVITTRDKRLSFEMGSKAAGQKVALRLIYFTEGVRWIPTYQISGDLKAKAGVALQGELLNEAEDIEDAEVELVVGVPNFRFKGAISPLALESAMRDGLRASGAASGLSRQSMDNDFGNFSNMITQQQGAYSGPAPTGIAGTGAEALLSEDLSAGGAQDLFIYRVGRRSLPRGARATAPLWETTAPLRHVYTLDVGLRRESRTGRTTDAQGSPLELAANKVWHQLEITNDGDQPWTTGAAMILQGQLPLGQELLTYTPTGGCLFLPVTVAVDVRGDYDEQEVSRRGGALRRNDHDYTLVAKKGSLTVTNFRKEATLMRISLSLGGKATSTTQSGKVKVDDARPQDWDNYHQSAINNHSDVTWELTLKPGERRVLEVGFEYYAW